MMVGLLRYGVVDRPQPPWAGGHLLEGQQELKIGRKCQEGAPRGDHDDGWIMHLKTDLDPSRIQISGYGPLVSHRAK